MSIELTLLVWSATLFAGYIGVQSTLYRLQHGIRFANSARDKEAPPDVWNARAEKALRNLIETYGVFVALAVATELQRPFGRADAMGRAALFLGPLGLSAALCRWACSRCAAWSGWWRRRGSR